MSVHADERIRLPKLGESVEALRVVVALDGLADIWAEIIDYAKGLEERGWVPYMERDRDGAYFGWWKGDAQASIGVHHRTRAVDYIIWLEDGDSMERFDHATAALAFADAEVSQ